MLLININDDLQSSIGFFCNDYLRFCVILLMKLQNIYSFSFSLTFSELRKRNIESQNTLTTLVVLQTNLCI